MCDMLLDYYFVLVMIFEIMDVFLCVDLKFDLLKELECYKL